MIITFTVPGEPVGKGRPRFVRATGRAYTPERTMTFENMVKAMAAEAMWERPAMSGPVMVDIRLYLGVAASWSKRKQQAALAWQTRPTKKPDVENVAKAILDAMQGVVFADDAQVCGMTVEKDWSDRPRTEVFVWEWEKDKA